MRTPLYEPFEFLDATAFNAAAASVSGDLNAAMLAGSVAGLVRPDVLTFTSTGLVMGVNMPSPFAIMFGNGVLAGAHGTVSNVDTTSGVVDFTSFVPVSGSTTVYLLASQASIQQNPYQIVGPQPGHPSYNPGFVPYTAYATTVDSLALAASGGGAGSNVTFELFRTTLAAGATGFGALDTTHQQLTTAIPTTNGLSITGNKMLGITDAGIMQMLDTAGLFITLPAASGFVGWAFPVISRAGTSTIQTSAGGDLIYGLRDVPGSGYTSGSIYTGQSLTLVAQAGSGVIGTPLWQVLCANNPASQQQLPLYETSTSSLSSSTANGSTTALISQTVHFPPTPSTGGFRIKVRGSFFGSTTAQMQQNFTLKVSDGTSTSIGTTWLGVADRSGILIGFSDMFYDFATIYAPGTSITLTLSVAAGSGGGYAGQIALSTATIIVQVQNA